MRRDTLPTIWPAEPHTLAKHKILERYLQAWMPILAGLQAKRRRKSPVRYVDGFAGPGVYEGGQPGSPIVAIRTADEHQKRFPVPIRMLFIENDLERFEALRRNLDGIRDCDQFQIAPPRHGDCEGVLGEILDKAEATATEFGPALVFLDQFGYSSVPLALIRRILRHDRTEVLTYLHWEGMHRFLSDSTKWPAISRAFGGEGWRPALGMVGHRQYEFFRAAYRAALTHDAGAKYVWDFAMCGEGGKVLYWLFFATGDLRGLEYMKKAMRVADPSGAFRFSDADAGGQLLLISAADDRWLGDHLHKHHKGETLSVAALEEFVLTRTPLHLFKPALRKLEREGRLAVESTKPGRRRGSFSDPRMLVRFL